MRIPKGVGACADLLGKLKAEKAELTKKMNKLDENYRAVKEYVIQTLPKSAAKGVSGKNFRATIKTKEVPSPKDWDKIYKHITRTKSFDLLQRRLSSTAVKDRWEDGKKIPGIESFTITDVSVTKA